MKALKRSLRLITCLLALMVLFTSCDEPEPIVNNITEKDANEIVVYLAGKGIKSIKQQVPSGAGGGGNKEIMWNILVMPDDSVRSMAVLNKVGLPRPPVKSLLDVFSSGGLVPSASEQKIKYQAALEDKIAGTIRKIDGVLSVDVQLSLPSEDSENEKPTASVFVKHQGVMDDPNNQLNTKIKRLVAGSVDALQYDQVTVISDLARFASVDLETKENIISEEQRNDYVGIWGIVVLKESVKTFRVVFFSAVVVLLIFFGMVLWMVWKTAPLVKSAGGFAKLLSFKPMKMSKVELPEEAESAEDDAESDGENEAESDDNADDQDENEDEEVEEDQESEDASKKEKPKD